MMIYITGDIHGNPNRISSKNFRKNGLDLLTKDDIIFICGDFGLPWNERIPADEAYWMKWLEKRAATVAFVDGNHENFDLLNRFPEQEWHGGRVHRVGTNILHLMRGEIFTVGQHKIFTFGGAHSIDRKYRVKNLSWWPEEIYSDAEYRNAVQNLEKCEYKVDLVLTHTAPQKFIRPLAAITPGEWNEKFDDPVSKMLSDLETKITYRKWYFGHFHVNWENKEQRCRGLYTAIDRIL